MKVPGLYHNEQAFHSQKYSIFHNLPLHSKLVKRKPFFVNFDLNNTLPVLKIKLVLQPFI